MSISPGFVTRITTGAPVPQGSDAVVQVEDTRLIKSQDEVRDFVEMKHACLRQSFQLMTHNFLVFR